MMKIIRVIQSRLESLTMKPIQNVNCFIGFVIFNEDVAVLFLVYALFC